MYGAVDTDIEPHRTQPVAIKYSLNTLRTNVKKDDAKWKIKRERYRLSRCVCDMRYLTAVYFMEECLNETSSHTYE